MYGRNSWTLRETSPQKRGSGYQQNRKSYQYGSKSVLKEHSEDQHIVKERVFRSSLKTHKHGIISFFPFLGSVYYLSRIILQYYYITRDIYLQIKKLLIKNFTMFFYTVYKSFESKITVKEKSVP